MDPESIEAAKSALRAAARGRRPCAFEVADAAHSRLLALPELERARTVGLYAARSDELPTDSLFEALRARGVAVVFPRVQGVGIELRRVGALSELVAGRLGTREPSTHAPCVPAVEVDAFIVPGLCFDRSGHRVGRGGGHYDRLLAVARSDAVRIGLCCADQIVDAVPSEPWDVGMHLVVTENEVLRPRASPARGARR